MLHLLTPYSTNTLAFVAISPSANQVVVTFRGTQFSSLANWINNLAAAKMQPYDEFPNAMVREPGCGLTVITFRGAISRAAANAI
jgi:hypothetical protein